MINYDEIIKKQQEWLEGEIRNKINYIAKRHNQEPFLHSLLLDVLHADTHKEMKDATEQLNDGGYELKIEQQEPEIDLENNKATIKPPTVKLYELLDSR